MAREGDTLSYVGDPGGSDSGRLIAPYLVLALECRQPLTQPERIGLPSVDRVTIGRGAERRRLRVREEDGVHLSLEVADVWMSSEHVRLIREAGAWLLEDAGSKNGTFVNGARCKRARLSDGDLIEAGSTIFLFRDPADERFGDREDSDAAALSDRQVALRTLSPPVARRYAGLPRVAVSDVPIILLGETGTGKELVARAIHALSDRGGRFVGVNCGALPRSLVESELFGHKKGAFSGATEDSSGLVRSADGGTLFLDEVAELPESSQVALLRVLQEREVRPVGAADSVPVDIRVIAATHQDLAGAVEVGDFREDLYARLAGLTVQLAPLRERREDLGLLIAELLPRVAGDRASSLMLSREAGRALFVYDWPRNIRELEHCLRTASALADGDTIELAHLPEGIRDVGDATAGGAELSAEDRELRDQLVDLLTAERGNVRAVARELGKAPVQIYRWCKRLDIDIDRFR